MKRASGLSLEDVTSGFRAYNVRALRLLSRRAATLLDYQDVGVLLLLQSARMKIMDVEIAMLPRDDGKSRIFHSWSTVAYYMLYTLMLGVSKRNPRLID